MSLVPNDKPAFDPDEPDLTLPDEASIVADSTTKQGAKQKRNYDFKAPIVTAITDEEIAKFEGIMVPVLPDSVNAVNEQSEIDRLGDIDVTEQSVSWLSIMTEGFRSHPAKGIFEEALADPNADWRNVLHYNNNPINTARPKFNNKGRGGQMSSDRLVMSVRSTLGLGAPVQEPLMGSGFYVTTKALGEDEIINLWREIIAAPVKLGRVTHGLMFSNNSVFTAKAVYEAWARTIITTTVSDLPKDNLADHLTINDLPTIAHAAATSLYPNGFPMNRATFHQGTGMPKEELRQLIDIRKSLFMNNNAFTEDQLRHMTQRIEQPMTLKQVKAYRDQFKAPQNTVVEVSEGIKLYLHTPSLREYFDSGEKWINEINNAVFNALGQAAEVPARLPYISRLAKASRLRQYSHYIKSVEEDGELYTTRENVDQVLTTMSSNDALAKKIYAAVTAFINSTQVAMVATTSVNEYEDTLTGDMWPRLIPIDAISVFFQLVEQKLLGISNRQLEDTLA